MKSEGCFRERCVHAIDRLYLVVIYADKYSKKDKMYCFTNVDKNDYKCLLKFSKKEEKKENSYVSHDTHIGDSYVSNQYYIEDEDDMDARTKNAMKKLKKMTLKLFESNGLTNSISKEGLIEYHRYLDGSEMPLDIHEDDFGALDYTVNTAIYYIEKTLSGGDLEIYSDDEKTVIETIYVTPPKDKYRVVIMEGNVKHNVSQITSSGIRECVVVQFRCVR